MSTKLNVQRPYTMKRHIILCIIPALLLTACSKKQYTLPQGASPINKAAQLYPDYTDITIPPNIAPLNFILQDSLAQEMVVCFKGKGKRLICGAEADLKLDLDTTQWRELLHANKGGALKVSIYARRGEQWICYPPYTLNVAQEPIDNFLSYRLIEPGYELYRQIGLYQRNLSNFTETTIYENNRSYETDNNHCVNCHNFQNYSTKNMMFHVRTAHAGTIIVRDGKAHKVQIKGDSILTAGVYPSWHPTLPLIAFSTNITGQVFHMKGRDKVEVLDERSDLLLYDVEKNEVKLVLNKKEELESFPCWDPKGKWLYYCVAREPAPEQVYPDSLMGLKMMRYHDSLFYDIHRIPFDARKRTFGASEIVVDCATRHRSATFPRISPDGRYVLWAESDYGNFHIWHQGADLYVKDLLTDSIYALDNANSPEVESYHTWSSNGRWIVFSSRRMDANYTRVFIAYFDGNGRAHKAFCLPQRDPEHNILLLKSYNVPELTREAIRSNSSELKKIIYESEGKQAKTISR